MRRYQVRLVWGVAVPKKEHDQSLRSQQQQQQQQQSLKKEMVLPTREC